MYRSHHKKSKKKKKKKDKSKDKDREKKHKHHHKEKKRKRDEMEDGENIEGNLQLFINVGIQKMKYIQSLLSEKQLRLILLFLRLR